MSSPEQSPHERDEEQIAATLQQHQYECVSVVGQGAFASVHLVKSVKYNRLFVAKVSRHKGDVPDEETAEITLLKGLSHPNIIFIYDFFSDSQFLYIILEYCKRGSLYDVIQQKGPLQGCELYKTCSQIAAALKYCHEHNIAHRDIKPANILIDQYGRPKLADFGLSACYSNDKSGTERMRVGSRAFMAPEVIKRQGYDAFKADIWSLGVTFYYLGTGTLPWPSAKPEEIEQIILMGGFSVPRDAFRKEFAVILRRMVQLNVKKRAPLEWVLDQPILKNECAVKFPSTLSHEEEENEQVQSLAGFVGLSRELSLTTTMLKHSPGPARLSFVGHARRYSMSAALKGVVKTFCET